MKNPRYGGPAHGRRTCGNCGRALKISSKPGYVACSAHLKVMPAEHPGECEHYRPNVENPARPSK